MTDLFSHDTITDRGLVCLEDGRCFKGGLKRHLWTRYLLTPEAYRAKWGLPADYPMQHPAFTAGVERQKAEAAAFRARLTVEPA